MVLKVLLRLLFIVFVSWFALAVHLASIKNNPQNESEYIYAVLYTLVAAVFAAGVVFFEWRFQRNLVRELVAVVFGLAAGLVVATLLVLISVAFLLGTAPETGGGNFSNALTETFFRVQPWIPLILLASCYITVTVVLQTRSDFRFLVPYIDFSDRSTQEGGVILDTSAIIDGRIADLCEARIVSAPVIIPDFVVRELQLIADSGDRLKRARGRRGLDVVAKLKKADGIRVLIRETDTPAHCTVDDELVRLAKEVHGRIITTDYNLNKVSQIEGITVINVNDIANAVKPAVLPGETLSLQIIRPGQEADQGVGYLQDGTMVVVENGRSRIGEQTAILVTGSIQTSAGRMVFGKPADSEREG